MLIKKTEFNGNNKGSHLIVLGAIHGDETCGPVAINKVIQQFESGELTLLKGAVTFVPVCNQKAYEQGTRYIDCDLNRYFKKHENPSNYEESIATELASLVDRCDYLLDIHSFGAEGKPFIFQDYTDTKTNAFAYCLGVPRIVQGWPEMYGNDEDAFNDGDTIGYAYEKNKIGVLIEAGQHCSSNAHNIAESAILRALSYLEMIEQKEDTHEEELIYSVKAKKVYYMSKKGSFVKKWEHFEKVSKGEVIAKYADGEELVAPEDGVILLPEHSFEVGQEWFSWGVVI